MNSFLSRRGTDGSNPVPSSGESGNFRSLAEADRMYLTREEQATLRADARRVARQLKNRADIIEPPAAKVVEDAIEIIGQGRHPERGTVFGIATRDVETEPRPNQ